MRKTLASLTIWSNRSEMPSGTPGFRAFTGGLLMVMIAMSCELHQIGHGRTLLRD
jgi:hypothetical protein